MQEEIENRSVTLIISGTKLTGRVLKMAITKYLAHRKEKKNSKKPKSIVRRRGVRWKPDPWKENKISTHFVLAHYPIRPGRPTHIVAFSLNGLPQIIPYAGCICTYRRTLMDKPLWSDHQSRKKKRVFAEEKCMGDRILLNL